MEESYDAKWRLAHYKPGDLILYCTESSQLDIVHELRVNFQGPYLVLTKVEDLDYRTQCDVKGTQKAVHHDKLNPYEGEQSLPWAKSALCC